MSAVIPFIQFTPTTHPNFININSVGIINLVSGLPQPPNGYVITDLCLTPFSYGVTAAGNTVYGGSFGMVDAALTPGDWIPVQSVNLQIVAAPAGGGVFAVQPFTRNFGSGLVVPQGFVLAIQTLEFLNLTQLNLTLDLTGFQY